MPSPAVRVRYSPLEEKKRLSSSVLWTLLASYYGQRGVKAWTVDAVPHHITSSAFIAGLYAETIIAFLRDRVSQIDPQNPVWIVEVGAGHGRFGFSFLRRLFDSRPPRQIEALRVRYLMTDFAESNIEFLKNHPYLDRYREAGVLDFAKFDAARDTEIVPLASDIVLKPGSVSNPLIAIANYIFDSLPQDAFQVIGGQLYEGLATISDPAGNFDVSDPTLVSRLSVEFHQSLAPASCYGDPEIDRILNEYRSHLPDSQFLFPVSALRCVQALRALTGGDLLLLSADKGYHDHAAILAGFGFPALTMHADNCFSAMVDFQAIGRLFENGNGFVEHPRHQASALSVSLFVGSGTREDYAETLMAFRSGLGRFGPDELGELENAILSDGRLLTFRQCLALLKLTHWDAVTFTRSLPSLRASLPELDATARLALVDALERVWENFMPIGEPTDLAFLLGTLLLECGSYDQALRYLNASAESFGEEFGSCYNIALCFFHLQRFPEAEVWSTKALAANSLSDEARSLQIHLQQLNQALGVSCA